jgi:hypothetical protein
MLAYLPDVAQMASLDPLDGGLWRSPVATSRGQTYRQCANYAEQQVCNWAVVASDPQALCISCRLTHVIPDMEVPGHRDAWYRLEAAKRRLVYTLLGLQLPLVSKQDDSESGLAFDFLSGNQATGEAPVLTGHLNGMITINIAEADDSERERRRTQLHEPYRTLLGHFRHESGHYYWDQLVRDHERLDAFRTLFGDERQDYAQAIQQHYNNGPSATWFEHFVSAYAGSHPWEDWAETWAHYLHITDTLETAAACGVTIRPRRSDEPALLRPPLRAGSPAALFDRLIDSWFPVTYVLNNLNRGLGLPDAYPFVLSPPAVDKLRFVHDTVIAAAASAKRRASRSSKQRARIAVGNPAAPPSGQNAKGLDAVAPADAAPVSSSQAES